MRGRSEECDTRQLTVNGDRPPVGSIIKVAEPQLRHLASRTRRGSIGARLRSRAGLVARHREGGPERSFARE
ncbi:hypothetical protein Y600_6020 [Burkholderia pseudomallei MSHR3709]|nr:hypothetical protein Y600_6020 [Burkholderia pseudomallei MSHR3709]